MTSSLFAPLNDQAAEQLVGGKRFKLVSEPTVNTTSTSLSVSAAVDDTESDQYNGTYSGTYTYEGYSFAWSLTIS